MNHGNFVPVPCKVDDCVGTLVERGLIFQSRAANFYDNLH